MRQTTTVAAAHRARSRFYLVAALVFLAVIATGFFGTYVVPMWQGRFKPLPFIHVHGALLLSWAILFAVQSSLVQGRRVALHRTLGPLALLIALGIFVSTVAVGVSAMHRDIAAGLGPVAISGLVGNFTSPLVFAVLLGFGLAYRRQPEVHKRLMFLATVAILWPAWFRLRHFFPGVPRPDLVFGVMLANLPVLVAMWHDWRRAGQVHPVYRVAGVALIVESLAETLLFDSPGQRALAGWLAGFFLPS